MNRRRGNRLPCHCSFILFIISIGLFCVVIFSDLSGEPRGSEFLRQEWQAILQETLGNWSFLTCPRLQTDESKTITTKVERNGSNESSFLVCTQDVLSSITRFFLFCFPCFPYLGCVDTCRCSVIVLCMV